MKTSLTALFVTLALSFQARAYLDVPDGALNVRHFHMVERDDAGEIVGRSFMNTFDIFERSKDDVQVLERRRCTTINACGTAGGCMVMAGQRYCDGVPWQKSFQDAVKQTGANGVTGLKLMAEGIGRGPVGMIAGAAKATAKAIIDAKKTTPKHHSAKKVSKPKKAHKKKAPAKHKASKHAQKAKKPSGKHKKSPARKGSKHPAKKSAKQSTRKSSKHPSKKIAKHPAKKSAKHPAKKSAKHPARKSAPKPSAKRHSKTAAKKPVSKGPAKKNAKPAPKKGGKKTRRELEEGDVVLDRRNFEIVERDAEFNLVERGEYSMFDVLRRSEDGLAVTRRCDMFNQELSCQ